VSAIPRNEWRQDKKRAKKDEIERKCPTAMEYLWLHLVWTVRSPIAVVDVLFVDLIFIFRYF
jgi:hypothetical protein